MIGEVSIRICIIAVEPRCLVIVFKFLNIFEIAFELAFTHVVHRNSEDFALATIGLGLYVHHPIFHMRQRI